MHGGSKMFGHNALETFEARSQISNFAADVIGCMDKNNLNYDPDANINDGDKCGGCIQGYTRIGESSFTCQEVSGKYIDCKTAEVFWKLKSNFKYRPPKESSNCSWWSYIKKCHEISVPAISNDGVITRTKHNWMHQKQTPQWSHIKDDIESKCGSVEELPITPEEVPNFLPASTTPPANLGSVDITGSYSEVLTENDTDSSLEEEEVVVAPTIIEDEEETIPEPPKKSNTALWIIGASMLAIGVYIRNKGD